MYRTITGPFISWILLLDHGDNFIPFLNDRNVFLELYFETLVCTWISDTHLKQITLFVMISRYGERHPQERCGNSVSVSYEGTTHIGLMRAVIYCWNWWASYSWWVYEYVFIVSSIARVIMHVDYMRSIQCTHAPVKLFVLIHECSHLDSLGATRGIQIHPLLET